MSNPHEFVADRELARRIKGAFDVAIHAVIDVALHRPDQRALPVSALGWGLDVPLPYYGALRSGHGGCHEGLHVLREFIGGHPPLPGLITLLYRQSKRRLVVEG